MQPTTRKKPGPTKGTPAVGHRPKTLPGVAQTNFWLRWAFFPASKRPAGRDMAALLGIGRDTFARRMEAKGANFTEAQCAAGLTHLEALHPSPASGPPIT